MTVLILVVCFALAVVFELYMLARNAEAERTEEARSRRALLAELARIEAHSPDHVIDGGAE